MRRARRQRAGYTLVEVMLAVSVLVVGATGFTFLQGASIRSVQNAQEHTVALQVLETWIERVRRDNSRWTEAGLVNTANTTYLKAGLALPGQWIKPPPVTDDGGFQNFAGADTWGWDKVDGPDVRYCTLLRYQVAHLSTLSGGLVEDALRVDVMVWRPRPGGTAVSALTLNGGTNCNANPGLLESDQVFKVVNSVVVRWQ
ncbi:MAG: prepilin-type N-terminal cleavage/methylation domain-containing protein [Myxococcales bacterium]